ncbi:MAG: class I SAM-dependent methyltransferase [Pirellulales bacterium]
MMTRSSDFGRFMRWLGLAAFVATASLRPAAAASPNEPLAVFIPLADAESVLAASQDVPAGLKGLSHESLTREWPTWVRSHDERVRSRVSRGEEDSLAFWLLYGVSFTDEPRATDDYRATLVRRFGNEHDADARVNEVLIARARDLTTALATPGDDERRLTMLEVTRRAGYTMNTPEERNQLGQYLLDNVVRCLRSYRSYTEQAQTAAQSNQAAEFSAPASLFRDRGLSTDTSVLADYAVEQALLEIKEVGLLGPGSVRRAGVIGPGLDLIDKDGGYDLYPPQSTQPFVLMDTLQRLELATGDKLDVAVFDISSSVTGHLERLVKRARDGRPYTLNLVRDTTRDWSPGAVRFWENVGSRIGTAGASTPSPDFDRVLTRAIEVSPRWAAKLRTNDLNIVFQQMPLEEGDRYDLLVATNVLIYYRPFEQSLALRNAARMLRPGGILISNTPLPDVADPDMRRVGETKVRVAGTNGHSVVWYQRGQ